MGEIVEILIGTDFAGQTPAWHLEQAEVVDMGTGQASVLVWKCYCYYLIGVADSSADPGHGGVGSNLIPLCVRDKKIYYFMIR